MEMKKKQTKGFTLIEMLTLVTVLGLIMVAGSGLLFGGLAGTSKAQIQKEVRQNGEYALKIIEETIKNAVKFEICDSSYVTVKDRYFKDITFKVLVDENGISRIASNSSFLTSEKVKVKNFNINCNEIKPGLPSKIGINFTLQQSQDTLLPQNRASIDFSTVVTMRSF